MTVVEKVKTAIIGCGAISKSYIESLQTKFTLIDLVGCHDRNPEKAHFTASTYGIKVLSWEEILSDSTIELVINLTAPAAHYEVIKTLLLAGKHVYTEKILTIELSEAKALLELADSRGCRLGSAPDTFLGASIQTAKAVIDSGLIGEITSCHCVLNRDAAQFAEIIPFTRGPGGGIGFDVGIYYLTALLSLLGPVKEVTGVSRTRHPSRQHTALDKIGQHYEIQCETLMAGTLLFASECIGSLLFNSETIQLSPEQPVLTLFGTKGIMYMADPNKFGGDVRVILKGNSVPFIMQQSHGYNDESRGLGAAEMAWALRKSVPHRASKEMAYHALEVLHGLVRSGEQRCFSTISSTFLPPTALPAGYPGKTYLGSESESALAL